MSDLYNVLKGRAYGVAMISSGRSNEDAKAMGFKDVYDLIMSDSDDPRQASFLTLLTPEMLEGHRKVLLDGMAREYANASNWMEYVERETK